MDVSPDLVADLQQRIVWLEERVAALEQAATGGAPMPPPPPPPRDPMAPAPHVLDLITRGKKIDAIKAYVDQTGVSLKEAKRRIDQLPRR